MRDLIKLVKIMGEKGYSARQIRHLCKLLKLDNNFEIGNVIAYYIPKREKVAGFKRVLEENLLHELSRNGVISREKEEQIVKEIRDILYNLGEKY